MAKPEQYGAIADGKTNCAYAINECIRLHNICEFGEGTYVIGGKDIDPNDSQKVLKSGILWGFNPTQNEAGVQLIGKGKGKTILKLSEDLTGRKDLGIP